MKKLIVFLILALLSSFGYSRSGVLPIPNQVLSGDTVIISNTSVCNGATKTLTIPSFLGFQTSCSYSCDGISYYTTDPHILLTFYVSNDTTFICYIDSINGVELNTTMAISISVICPPTVSIPVDSIYHVKCPNGAFHPYGDGSFHVDLLDPVQDYTYVKVRSDSSFFFEHTYYDDFTVAGLRGGTYQVEALGTNGCVYHDSVVIQQPEAWYWNHDSLRLDTVCFGETGCISISICGGTPPYDFTWFYFDETSNGIDTVYLPDTTRLVCGLLSGYIYCIDMFDSRGCRAFGSEMSYAVAHLYEYVEDGTHIITSDPIACYGHEFMVQAQSIGVGTYTWTIGNVDDSTNYWTSIYGDSMFVADYMTPPLFQPTYVVATFSD